MFDSFDIPSGYFVEDHQIWGEPSKGAILSRIYDVSMPDTYSSGDDVLQELEQDFRLMIGGIQPDERLQVQYYTDNAFSFPLDRFESQTRSFPEGLSSAVRYELIERYRQRIKDETLIHSNMRLCLSTKIPRLAKQDGRKVKGFNEVFQVLKRSFEQREQFFDMLLRGHGSSVKGLDNWGHYEEMLKYWSPSQARLPQFPDLDWMRPVDSLCRFSGLSPRSEPDHGFYMDGYYFDLIVAKTMPSMTWAKTMEPFLALAIPHLRVVLNMCPLSFEASILYEKERFSKLYSNAFPKNGAEPDPEAIAGLELHQIKINKLLANKVIPFNAQLIVTVRNRTPDGLDSQLEAIRVALSKTGCEAFQPSISTSCIGFFNCSTPGIGPWIEYEDFRNKMSDALNVGHMWPAGSTPKADLDEADWICDGDQNNLIGGKCFSGSNPIHTVVAGTSGSGKSSFAQYETIQTAPKFGYLVVIDDGSVTAQGQSISWAKTCQKLDPNCRPICVESNGKHTFNIFDTDHLSLTPQHKSSATALCHLLVGRNSDSDKDKIRSAILHETISEIYAAFYRKWRSTHPQDHYDFCLELAKKRDLSQSDILALDIDPKMEHLVRDEAFSLWTPDMFPTLFDLQDELNLASFQKGPHQEVCATLATLLRPWLRDGRYGPIVDGYSNVDLGSAQLKKGDPLKVVYFDIGAAGHSEKELKTVLGFLIVNHVLNHIQRMPRSICKRVVIEEMNAFLDIPNAEDIVVKFWQQMRKFSAQMWAIFQNYSTLLEASEVVAKAIISNSSALFLFRNPNRKDLETLGKYLPRDIPQVAIDHITRFPKPLDIADPDQRYAGFDYVQLDKETPVHTIGRAYISEEVENLTTSSGDRI